MKLQKPPKNNNNTKRQYEELGRIVASVYETGYLDRATAYKSSFIKGLFQGFGGAIGATVLVALVVWVLSLFSQVPLVGRFTNGLHEAVNSAQDSR